MSLNTVVLNCILIGLIIITIIEAVLVIVMVIDLTKDLTKTRDCEPPYSCEVTENKYRQTKEDKEVT